jgi:acyl-CoA synthetase (AMP-forming)/AMP-acid ligase II
MHQTLLRRSFADSALPSGNSFVSVLLDWAEERCRLERSFHFRTYPLGRSAPATVRRDFGAMVRESMSLAENIAAETRPGDRVLVVVEPGQLFHRAFLSCLLAGVVAVPLPEPMTPAQAVRMRAVAADCGVQLAVVGGGQAQSASSLASELGIRPMRVEEQADKETCFLRPKPSALSDVLYLQYTSGSTGDPKGVIVSDANVTVNVGMMRERWQLSDRDRLVSWLPPYHDMGLITGLFLPLWCGGESLIMRTMDFGARPERWLAAIEEFRATISVASNFAYELCAGRISSSGDRTPDLNSLRLLLWGAEPIRAKTMQRFLAKFGSCGIMSDHFCPAYGLAEATLMVTGRDISAGPPTMLMLDRAALAQGIVRKSDDADAVTQVSCGPPGNGIKMRIVDPQDRHDCGPDRVGEIWVAGESVCSGYWGTPSGDHLVCEPDCGRGGTRWLRTGDLGFTHDGELYVTGRLKDILIVNGANLAPADLEEAIEMAHPDLRTNGCAVFSEEGSDRERIIVLHELSKGDVGHGPEICQVIVDALRRSFAVIPDEIALIRKRGLVRTTSGKLSRSGCRAAYAAGSMDVLFKWRRSTS